MADAGGTGREPGPNDTQVRQELMLIARMFAEYREDPVMREFCRLAVKCAQEGVIKQYSK